MKLGYISLLRKEEDLLVLVLLREEALNHKSHLLSAALMNRVRGEATLVNVR